jgi:hypothetical protein
MQDILRRSRHSLAPFTLALLAFAGLTTGCGGGGGGGDSPASSVASVLQDLDEDPNGVVTVVSFDGKAPAGLDPADFEASDGQTALAVVVTGSTASVTWDAHVGTASDVRVVGVPSIDDSFVDVTTSNATAPTFTIENAVQAPDFADDAFEVHFSGPRVIEDEALDVAAWELAIDGDVVDFSTAAISFDPDAQIATVTLGGGAGLHGSFELRALALHSVADVALATSAVAGTAAGDAVAPTLLSAEQNLVEDEYGRVIDFTFSEAMDPFFSTEFSDYIAGFPTFAIDVTQPTPDVVRVTFNAPIVPGFATITFGDLTDAHGNPFATPTTGVTSPGVAQAFASETGVITVENLGGDYLTVATDWALLESYAEDAGNWTVTVDGNPVDLSGETFSYDLLTKTLVVTLPDDYDNGDAFTVDVAGVYSIDGATFTDSTGGVVDGDVGAATVVSITQNRNVDPDGLTYDVLFSEQVDETAAETPGNYVANGGATIATVVLQGDQRTVRLTTDLVVLPGGDTFDVLGGEDIAGNATAAELAVAVVSTDVDAPTPGGQVAYAEEGSENDTLTVVFSDDMLEADVLDPTHWHFQSPIGVAVDTSLASVSYDEATRTGVLTFDGGDDVNLQTRTDFLMAFSSMRDIGGNPIATSSLYGVVNAESNSPRLLSVWQPGALASTLNVRFSEEVTELDDIGGLTSYTLRDAGGVAQGTASAVTLDSDGMGAELSFGIVITPGVHTLDVEGVLDLAGNAMFPALLTPIETEDAVGPTVSSGTIVSVSGEDNDQLTIVFDKSMHPLGITDPEFYRLEVWNPGYSSVDLSDARFSFDGVDTVTVDLDTIGALSLESAATYQFGSDGDGLQSAQGVSEPFPTTFGAQLPSGDVTAPDFTALRVMLDAQDSAFSVIMDLDEAIDIDDANDELLVDIGGTHPDLLEPLGLRTVRATFAGGVSAGQTINFSVRDLAGNLGAASAAIQALDSAAPLLASVQAIATSGSGGDEIRLSFDEPLLGGPLLDLSNYTLSEAGSPLSLAGSTVRYVSGSNTVRILLPDGVNLTDGASATIGVADMVDHSGNAMSAAVGLTVAVSGDAVAPDLDAAFVNYRADLTGLVVDVQFSEEVRVSEIENTANWSVSGAQSIVSVERLRDDQYRITLSAPLAGSDTLTVAGVHDHAGNTIGVGSIDPHD